MAGTPGEGGVFQTPWQMLESIVLVLKWLLQKLAERGAADLVGESHTVADWVHDLFKEAVPERSLEPKDHHLLGLVERVGHWVASFGGDHQAHEQDHHAGIAELVRTIGEKVHVDVEGSPSTEIRDL